MHKYLSETRLSFWFLESGRNKKSYIWQKVAHHLCQNVCFIHVISTFLQSAFSCCMWHFNTCNIETTGYFEQDVWTISSSVCTDRDKKQHDLVLILTRASAQRCTNLKLKTGEKSSNGTEKKHNNNISVLCRNTHC